MTPHDILYTPLDTSDVPTVNLEVLTNWISKYQVTQLIQHRDDASESMPANEYPWNIIYPRHQYTWYKNFDILFPELVNYISSNFKVSIDEIQDVVLLPLKKNFIGTGFFHSDPDECGIRFYLENNELNDFLLVNPTIKPYTSRTELFADTGEILQPIIHSVKMLKPTQAFFINNVRALHAANSTRSDCSRIAVTVTIPKLLIDINDELKSLIVSSAKKFADYSVLWTQP